jgi:hypothetical protein|tara:strand:+ start:189 stop:389 length:201 start_codon:yes stop_codon:yes gene_type:complete
MVDVLRALEHMLKFLQERQEGVATSVMGGTPKDFIEYKYNLGLMKGLVVAEEEIARILKREDDDDG